MQAVGNHGLTLEREMQAIAEQHLAARIPVQRRIGIHKVGIGNGGQLHNGDDVL